MATNHDRLMKELIARFPDQFLRLAAPEIAEQVDLGALSFEPEEHYSGSPTRHARRADLVTPARPVPECEEGTGEDEEVLLHVEIELEHRARVEPKLMSYHRGLSLKHALPVHTIVLFLRGGPAGSQARMYEERSLGRVVGSLGYYSLGLSQAPASEYLARPEPLAWAFAALMRPAKGQRRSKLGLACVRKIADEPGLSKDERQQLLSCVLMYADFDDDDASAFDRIMSELEHEEVRDVRMSMTERWRREGLEQGRADGVRDLVLRLLGQRFGNLSSEVRRRVAAIASADELSRLAERVYQVESLEELELA